MQFISRKLSLTDRQKINEQIERTVMPLHPSKSIGEKQGYILSVDNDMQFTNCKLFLVEVQWPNGQCIHSRSEWSGFQPWLGTLCCVLGQDT